MATVFSKHSSPFPFRFPPLWTWNLLNRRRSFQRTIVCLLISSGKYIYAQKYKSRQSARITHYFHLKVVSGDSQKRWASTGYSIFCLLNGAQTPSSVLVKFHSSKSNSLQETLCKRHLVERFITFRFSLSDHALQVRFFMQMVEWTIHESMQLAQGYPATIDSARVV